MQLLALHMHSKAKSDWSRRMTLPSMSAAEVGGPGVPGFSPLAAKHQGETQPGRVKATGVSKEYLYLSESA